MSVLMLLAPSKTMDFTSSLPYSVALQRPIFHGQAHQVVTKLQAYSEQRLMKLMAISQPIAAAVKTMYQQWDESSDGRPALWTYKGDVYKGIKAQCIDEASAAWAERHLLMLSGLYGLVRPYDGIQRYRLEMKTQLKIGRAQTLNEFWGSKLSDVVAAQGSDWICNLSSDEYAKPALRYLPANSVVITPVFFDTKLNGIVGTVPIYSKMMRGVMCRWMIDNRVDSPEQLEQFAAHGYAYDDTRSKPNAPAFLRAVMKPLVFD